MKKTGRSVVECVTAKSPYSSGFGLRSANSRGFAPITPRPRPEQYGFFIGRTVRDSNEPDWAADKNTHGAYSHGAYPSRRVRERPRKFKGQW